MRLRRVLPRRGWRATIFFDVGGTLVDAVVDPADPVVSALDALGVGGGPVQRQEALQAMAHASAASLYAPSSAAGEARLWWELARVCLDRLPGGATADRLEGLAAVLAGYDRWYRPVRGMPALVGALRRSGLEIGIISNWPPSLEGFLLRLGFGRFPLIACSGTLRCAKPDPAIFRWALARAGKVPAACWHVGNDAAADYAPAAALGMRAVLWDPAGRCAGQAMCRAGSVAELRALLLGA